MSFVPVFDYCYIFFCHSHSRHSLIKISQNVEQAARCNHQAASNCLTLLTATATWVCFSIGANWECIVTDSKTIQFPQLEVVVDHGWSISCIHQWEHIRMVEAHPTHHAFCGRCVLIVPWAAMLMAKCGKELSFQHCSTSQNVPLRPQHASMTNRPSRAHVNSGAEWILCWSNILKNLRS